MKTIICLRRRLALLITLLALLSGCTGPSPPSALSLLRSFSCASFTESLWQEFRFGVDSPDDVVATAARLWEIEREQVQFFILTDSERVSSIRWRSDAIVGSGGTHRAWFGKDQTLARIEVKWGSPQPALAQVIDCLGFPERYIAYYDQGPDLTFLNLVLLYTESGIAVSYVNNYILFTPPANHAGLPMERFVVVAPGTAEQMVSDLYSHRPDKSAYVLSLCLMKPWPGSIEAMETATKEEQRRCRVRP